MADKYLHHRWGKDAGVKCTRRKTDKKGSPPINTMSKEKNGF